MSSLSQKLTIIVPAYQCAGDLERHSESLEFLRKKDIPIIWIVSPSQDRSEVAAERLANAAGDSFFLSPIGLYQSWNFGVKKVKTPFVGISTIGDYYTNDEITKIPTLLETLSGDICFSPPFLDQSEIMLSSKNWPVYRFRKELARYDSSIVPRELLLRLQFRSELSCLLGSWASIVARTTTLQKYPFPFDMGHHSDTAWFYRNLHHLNCVFYDRTIATFTTHPTPQLFSATELAGHYDILMRTFLRMSRRGNSREIDFCLNTRKYLASLYLLNKIRGAKPKRGWWLIFKNWKLRWLRERYKRRATL